jgi:hypothetical protein
MLSPLLNFAVPDLVRAEFFQVDSDLMVKLAPVIKVSLLPMFSYLFSLLTELNLVWEVCNLAWLGCSE